MRTHLSRRTFCLIGLGLLSVFAACGPRPIADAAAPVAPPDSLAESRQRLVEQVLDRIEGREEEPSGDVFENVQILQGVPAGRLLRIMDVGYGRSLGVSCDHCHDTEAWASDDKRPKLAAREMMEMVQVINQDVLGRLEHLESDEPTVNCTTCHRGQIKPALDMLQ